ncbi:MAG: TnpV protein [Eubacterium sp.]|nr:TnpV protein [Eubacterium sp.]
MPIRPDELADVIEENGIVYRLGEHDLYYPDFKFPEGTDYDIGKYGLMRWEYMKANHKAEYFHLYLDGKLNEYLHEVDEECHERVDLLVEQMKAGAGITEKLKAKEQVTAPHFECGIVKACMVYCLCAANNNSEFYGVPLYENSKNKST